MGTPIKSQKTELYWASAATAATRVVAVSAIDGLGGPADRFDTSSLDNATDKTYVGGLNDPGQVTVSFNVNQGEAAHEALFALKAAQTEVSWGIYGPQAATSPTVVASVMQPVVDRTSIIFSGYVADINISINEGIWKGTITIQRSGAVAVDLLVA